MKTTTHKNSNTLLKSAKRHLNQGVSLDLIRQGQGAWREDNKTRLEEIALMQTAFNNRGFSTGTPDGYYGKNTVQGVKRFQQSQGLTADGVFGKRTLYALEQQVGRLARESVPTPQPTTLQPMPTPPTPPMPTPSHGLLTSIDTTKHGDGGTVKVHSKCLYNSSVLGTLASGTMVQIDNTTATWAKIPYGNRTGYVLAKFVKGTASYDRDYTNAKRHGLYGTYYSENKLYTVTNEEKDKANLLKLETNARYIYKYLKKQEWADNPIFAVLGNMQVESTLNPGVWEGRKLWNENNGFGLTQWTKAREKILPYAQGYGKPIDDMDMQLQCFCKEMEGGKVVAPNSDYFWTQWLPKKVDGVTATQFKTNELNYSVEKLAELFVRGYERPHKPNYSLRKQYARDWANFFHALS